MREGKGREGAVWSRGAERRARVRSSIYRKMKKKKKKEVTVHERKTWPLNIENGGCDGLWLKERREK